MCLAHVRNSCYSLFYSGTAWHVEAAAAQTGGPGFVRIQIKPTAIHHS